MKLLKVRFKDFRRFRGTCTLDLDEKLVALVGPNEAGKSSILDGIDMLLARRRPAPRDVPRGFKGQAEIAGLFFLEEDDREAIAGIHDADQVKRVWVILRSGGDGTLWQLDHSPVRDLRPRQRCGELVQALEGDPALDAQYSSNPELPWDPQPFADAMEQLASDSETLSEQVIANFEALAARLQTITFPNAPDAENGQEPGAEAATIVEKRGQAREAAVAALIDQARIERLPRPWSQVVEILDRRLPSAAFYRQEDRELRTDYVLAEVVENPPSALASLCGIAGLSLQDLNANWQTNRPQVVKWVEDANARLKARFRRTWNQSTVYPRFDTPNDGSLRLFISTEGDAGYSEVHERSDGLRWFLALDAFLATRGSQLQVLLVDEAETHLHYDAQADLIDALMRPSPAAKVVYTTHSVGCLPADLGRGIRAVLPEGDSEQSKIENSYWSIKPDESEKVGYTPLLFAMGAKLLSLTVPRYGLICEGPSEAILLPTLLRGVAGLDALPYRVVPGLSEISKNQMTFLATHAGKVSCLTDGDAEGKQILEQIKASGSIQDSCLFTLAMTGDGFTLEDLVDADAFATAVNRELETWGLTASRLSSADVPDTGRSKALKTWCETHHANPESLNKNRIAQRVVDLRSSGEDGSDERSVVSAKVADDLLAMHEAIVNALQATRLAERTLRNPRTASEDGAQNGITSAESKPHQANGVHNTGSV